MDQKILFYSCVILFPCNFGNPDTCVLVFAIYFYSHFIPPLLYICPRFFTLACRQFDIEKVFRSLIRHWSNVLLFSPLYVNETERAFSILKLIFQSSVSMIEIKRNSVQYLPRIEIPLDFEKSSPFEKISLRLKTTRILMYKFDLKYLLTELYIYVYDNGFSI